MHPTTASHTASSFLATIRSSPNTCPGTAWQKIRRRGKRLEPLSRHLEGLCLQPPHPTDSHTLRDLIRSPQFSTLSCLSNTFKFSTAHTSLWAAEFSLCLGPEHVSKVIVTVTIRQPESESAHHFDWVRTPPAGGGQLGDLERLPSRRKSLRVRRLSRSESR